MTEAGARPVPKVQAEGVVHNFGAPSPGSSKDIGVNSGQVVVVFGGSSGIGEAVARKASADGSQVVIVGRNPEHLDGAKERLSSKVCTAAVDANDRTAVDRFFEQLGDTVDHLVLSFSSGRAGGPFRGLAMADLAAAVNGKLVAYLSVLQSGLPHIRPDGSVVLVGAGSAEASIPGSAGLAAVNGGIHAAVRPLAVELAPLRVNAVAPGVIETPWWDNLPAPVRDGIFANTASAPLGRTGRPEDVASVVALLIDSDYVTGAVIPCDGGLRLR
jgi:NAD(P)-dependent dehydrogenase (short-subunit alcohol dehydrogenase family)